MNFYSGIDLHSRQSTLCVIDDKDNIHLRTTVPNQIEQILQLLQSFTPSPEVAVEATLNWYWLVVKIIITGIVAIAHLTINTTIDEKDIITSVTRTSLIFFDPTNLSLLKVIDFHLH